MTIVDNVDGTYIAHDPAEHCRHGVYTGGCGYDFMCHACEMGDPDPTPRELAATVQAIAEEIWTFWDQLTANTREMFAGTDEPDGLWADLEEAFDSNRMAGDLRRAVQHRDSVLRLANGPDDDDYLRRIHNEAMDRYNAQVHQWAHDHGFVLVDETHDGYTTTVWRTDDGREVTASQVYRAYEREA